MPETWLLCSACRSDIPFASKYYQCSVSTCNRARMRLVFCSVSCWDSHVATLRHRDAWAEDKIAPTQAAWEREQASDPEPARGSPPAAPAPQRPAPSPPRPSPPHSGSSAHFAPSTSTAHPAAPAVARPAAPAPPVPAAPVRRVVGDPPPAQAAPSAGAGQHLNDVVDRDMLIVVSKMKKYIKDRSGMNCSDAVAEVLSDHIRVLCDDSIRAAGRDERKTVLDRDVPRPRPR
ncbi:MAG TPA: hypothetical protein VFK02_25850 [Kofleriaceae bacterium]|nr:hypothetical protein [Kofleriaceae bacterium]